MTELRDALCAQIERLRMQLADHGETITRLQEQLTVVRELRDCDMREIERLTEALHWWQSIEQVRLNSEIERLQHDNMRLQTAKDYAYDPHNGELSKRNREIERLLAVCKDKTTLLKDAYAENERLTAERDRLLNAFAAAYGDAEARRALEPKP